MNGGESTMVRYERAWTAWLSLAREKGIAQKARRTFREQRRLNAARELVADLSEQLLQERLRREQTNTSRP